MVSASTEGGRMAMVGSEIGNSFRKPTAAVVAGAAKDRGHFGKKSSAYEEDFDGASDDEFNEMEEKIVQEALR